MNNIIRNSILLFFLLLLSYSIQGQGKSNGLKEISIQEVSHNINKKTIDLRFSIDNQGQPMTINAPDIQVSEFYNNEKFDLNIERISSDHKNQIFIYLIDQKGGSDFVEPVFSSIKKSKTNNRLPLDCQTEPEYFESLDEIPGLIESKGAGKEAIVYIFTTANGSFSKENLKAEAKEKLINKIKNIDLDLNVFPIVCDPKVDRVFMESLSATTRSTADEPKLVEPVSVILVNAIQDIQKIFFDKYLIELTPPNPIYRGETRQISIKWKKDNKISAQENYGASWGTANNELDLRKTPPPTIHNWLNWFFIGAIIISGILAFFSVVIPIVKKSNFKKRFVQPYSEIKKPGMVQRDPLTGDPFEEDELIVTKCEHLTTLSSWEYNKNQCLYYPDSCQEGVANVDSSKFFSQEGINRYLNWLWFGTLGGLISWSIIALLKNFGLGLFEPVSYFLSNIYGIEGEMNAFSTEWLTGLSLGLGLTFSLAWVEQRGQSSKLSWAKIIMKSLFGGILAAQSFLIGYWLLRNVLPNPFLAGLITWLLLGIFLGLVISFKSSVEVKRGLLGGMLAGLLSFILYFFLADYWNSSEMLRMISFFLFGGVMGFIMVSIIKGMEDFELEYISPEKYRRVNPISKWLKTGIDIFIGSDAGCYVFVKWNDPAVQGRHAKLSFDGNHVYIHPIGETWVNNRVLPLNSPTVLKDKDIIKLGTESVTRIQFHEKRKSTASVVPEAQPVQAIPKVAPKIQIRKR